MAAQVFGQSEKLLCLVKLLISLGCDINNSDKTGWTPLYHAAFGGELGKEFTQHLEGDMVNSFISLLSCEVSVYK